MNKLCIKIKYILNIKQVDTFTTVINIEIQYPGYQAVPFFIKLLDISATMKTILIGVTFLLFFW